MTYLSKDARRLVEWLATKGIDLAGEDLYDIEVATFWFFPNHIEGVFKTVLSGKTVVGRADKLAKAQEQGFRYFIKPIYSLLNGRREAHRRANLGGMPKDALGWWWRCQNVFLVRDMDRGEADAVIWELPLINPSLERFNDALLVSRERDIPSPRYLVAILLRDAQEKQGKAIREAKAKEREQTVWLPVGFEQLTPVVRAGLEIQWRSYHTNVEIIRALRSHGSKD